MGLRDKNRFNDRNIFFITTTCYKWLKLLEIGNSSDIVCNSLNFCCKKYQSKISGYVIMPNHIHLIIYFPEGSKRIDFMRDFKKFTSTQIRKEIEKTTPNFLELIRFEKDKQLFKIWQDRFDELYLVSRKLLEQKLLYIHNNPLQEHWSLVKEPKEYKYSSARFYETGEQGDIPISHYLEFV
jgi:putative transposase